MSFFSWVVRLILKKTSLLLSVTLMFKCSVGRDSSGLPAPGLPPLSEPDMLKAWKVVIRWVCARDVLVRGYTITL